MPAAACWVFEVALPLQCRCPRIPFLSKSVCPSLLEQADFSFVLQGCRRQTLGITQQSLTFKDASGRLWGLRSNPSLSRMPAAACWDYAAIPHFPGCQRQLVGITQQSLTFQDAVGRLLGLRSNPSLSRMPSADFWDYAAIPHLQGASGSLLGFRGGIIFRNTYTLLPTVTYTFAIPLLYP